MYFFDDVRAALSSAEHSEERTRALALARDYLGYLHKNRAPERQYVERISPGRVDETLEHQISNLEVALKSPGTPHSRCASGFFNSLEKEYGF